MSYPKPRPSWLPPEPTPENPEPDKTAPAPEESLLADIYAKMRIDGYDLEDLISVVDAEESGWTDEDRKRLDKAAVLLKVGMKIVKKVLKSHGFRSLKPIILTSEQAKAFGEDPGMPIIVERG